MCTRISIFAPTSADLSELERWSRTCGVEVERVPGASGQWRDTTILVTHSPCDCGTPIGARSRTGTRHNPERTVRELRKRGWSEAKIARSLAQKKDAGARREARRTAVITAGLSDWVAFLKGAPTHGHLESIGIFYRENGEWLSSEELEEGRRETAPLSALEPPMLAGLKEGVLYTYSTTTPLRD